MFDSRRFCVPGAVVLVAVLLVPSVGMATPGSDERSIFGQPCGSGKHNSRTVQSRNGRYDITVKQGRCRLEVEMRGDLEFLSDESGLASMSRRARLEITEEIGRDKRRIVATPGKDGQPVYEWSIDGHSADFDDEAQAWLGRTLPMIFRSTGIDAEARVGRILKRAGVRGVLDEVTFLSGDYTLSIYLKELVRLADLDEGQLEEMLELAGREISSDFELAELLMVVAGDLDVGSLPRAYIGAIETIGSDFEHRRVLDTVLSRESLDPRLAAELLSTAEDISSDFEVAELLVKAARVFRRGEALPDSFFRVLKTIGSDFEHRRVLDAALANRELTPEGAQALLEASSSIGSDFEMAEFLISLSRKYPKGEAMPAAFEKALDSVGSSFERKRVLAALPRS